MTTPPDEYRDKAIRDYSHYAISFKELCYKLGLDPSEEAGRKAASDAVNEWIREGRRGRKR